MMQVLIAFTMRGLILVFAFPFFAGLSAAWSLEIKAGVLRIDYPELAPVSRFDRIPDDLAFAGARLGNEDNQTTGSFLGHEFSLETATSSPENLQEKVDLLLRGGVKLLVVNGRGEDVLKVADLAGPDVLVFNVAASETDLRDGNCKANLLHVAPSRAMLADAVSQFLMWKKWSRWLLISGSNPDDVKLADAYRRSATKFGAKIVEERVFEDTGGSRRADSGHVLVQRQIPVFTQEAREHDVIVAADESDVFALYLPYQAWSPRPVAGSGGLRPVNFHAAHEAWGATQFQRRFEKQNGRYILPEDYNAWLALRVIGEAVTRTSSADPEVMKEYILSDAFELAAFKGQKVTFRSWNGQMRQPILLTDSKITVSVSPQDGYLHHRSPLDSLGLDEAESACAAFRN
ncbi:ABC transporter substrate binding protein (PQQ-dependent alcohol dehydrogenase system) [Roseibium marinum]|uniref:ABC transporter substrate binding protein (PQQ-dependent alcohol dehydrogenase system) n=2 Tax=Roseibium marinum TaxID=281252 RepID=A0A2S3UJZ2_9HYPH|nr:ABC transporter substrate binding protein (PQQ-dependent alcohol dehydrogenase system) [Roseibium marinum]